jgi:hypothetical protein
MKVSGFSKSVPFTPEFNDNKKLPEVDQLRFKLTPLSMDELIVAQEALRAAQPKEGEKATPENIRQMGKTYAPVLRDHVEITQGAEGFMLEDIATYAHFVDLAIELFKQLSVISQPTEQDVKN